MSRSTSESPTTSDRFKDWALSNKLAAFGLISAIITGVWVYGFHPEPFDQLMMLPLLGLFLMLWASQQKQNKARKRRKRAVMRQERAEDAEDDEEDPHTPQNVAASQTPEGVSGPRVDLTKQPNATAANPSQSPSTSQDPTQGVSTTPVSAPMVRRDYLSDELTDEEMGVALETGKERMRLLRMKWANKLHLSRQIYDPRLSDLDSELQKVITVQRMVDLTEEAPEGIIAYVNTKGGAATTTTVVNLTCTHAWHTQTVTVVFDGNPASGTSAARLGKDYDQTITVQELWTDLSELSKSFKKLIVRIRPNKWFVRAISADDITEAAEENPLQAAQVIGPIVDEVADKCEFLHIDTMNDITTRAALEMFSRASVLVFTANVQVKESLRKLATSMQTLRNYGFEEKVNRSVVVISNLPKGADLDDYRKYLNQTNRKDQVVQHFDSQFAGHFMGISHDPVIIEDDEVELFQWSDPVKQQYRLLDLAVMQTLREARIKPPHDTYQRIKPGEQNGGAMSAPQPKLETPANSQKALETTPASPVVPNPTSARIDEVGTTVSLAKVTPTDSGHNATLSAPDTAGNAVVDSGVAPAVQSYGLSQAELDELALSFPYVAASNGRAHQA